MSMFEKMMQQYEASKPKPNKPKVSEADRMKKYFSTWMPDGVQSMDKKIRILPALPGESTPFANIKAHSIQVGGKWEKFICPEFADGKVCPICDARRELLATGDELDRKAAKSYSERDMYVVRIIERGKEADGVKFWRFNLDYTNNGVFDKIINVIKLLGADEDITSVENGLDLNISINRNQTGQPTVVSINADRYNTPLTNDPELTASIMANTETWRDVYSVKPTEYLSLIVQGATPVWSKELNKYVAKEEAEANTMTSDKATNQAVTNLMANKTTSQPVQIDSFIGTADADLDDVPF